MSEFINQKFGKEALLYLRDISRAETEEEYNRIISAINSRIGFYDREASDLLDQSIDAHEKANAMEEEVSNMRREADSLLEDSNHFQERSEEYRNLLKFIRIACKPRF